MSGVGKGGPIMASEPRWQSFCFKTKRSGSKTAPTLFRQFSPAHVCDELYWHSGSLMTTRPHPPPLPGKSRVPWAVKLLVGLGILFGVVLGLFHPVENWRGKRAWESCKRGLKAKGESLDWDSFVPPAIPEERNVVRASAMEE